jgi:hypothetical protein
MQWRSVGWAKSPPEAATIRTALAGDFAHADGTRAYCARARRADESVENRAMPTLRVTPIERGPL